jgi:hypothetical protein
VQFPATSLPHWVKPAADPLTIRNPGGGDHCLATGTVVGVHRPDSGSPSKLAATGVRPLGLTPNRLLMAGLLAPAAWLLAGCSSPGGDLISTVALPSEQSSQADGDALDVVASPDADQLSGKPDLTPTQRDYLDALLAAGVQPSNDLRALSIGAYVCQAKAAGQSEQAVWDAVAPMVRSDVAAAPDRPAPDVAYLEVDTTIGSYISIATEKLC